MSFDLNIQNYRPEDVVALFKLPTTYCDADIDEKAQAIRTQLLTEDMPVTLKDEISIFLDAARDMIKRDWVPQAPGREDLIGRPALPYVPAKNEEFTKGDFNPYAKRTMTKIANIDTLFRTNSSTTSSTNFSYVLPESIRNVMSMRLSSIEIHYESINTFSSANKSNIFYLKLYNIKNQPDRQVTINIPDGNYTLSNIETTISLLLFYQNVEFVVFNINPSTGKSVFRARSIGETGGNSPYDNTNPATYSPDFRFELFFGVETKLLCASAGWSLGFRKIEYDAPPTQTYKDNERNVVYKNFVMSEGTFGNSTDSYLFLEVDDYHNNFQTDTVISTNATSYVGNNILARVLVKQPSFSTQTETSFKKREYLGPVRIEKLHFRLLNKFGEVVDMSNDNYSFALEFVSIYS
jgi:hypothetical protein